MEKRSPNTRLSPASRPPPTRSSTQSVGNQPFFSRLTSFRFIDEQQRWESYEENLTSTTNNDSITLLTWNVLFNIYSAEYQIKPEVRYPLILDVLENLDADIIALQVSTNEPRRLFLANSCGGNRLSCCSFWRKIISSILIIASFFRTVGSNAILSN